MHFQFQCFVRPAGGKESSVGAFNPAQVCTHIAICGYSLTILLYIIGDVVAFAGLGFFSFLRKLVICNWPRSTLGKTLAWSPPIQVELGERSAGFALLRRLVESGVAIEKSVAVEKIEEVYV
jgi:hypothetical protein